MENRIVSDTNPWRVPFAGKQKTGETGTGLRWVTAAMPLVILAALLLRLVALGSTPLSEHESSLALQALNVSQGGEAAEITQPLYVLITAGIFSFFGTSDFFARFFPALTGFALVCLPLFFSDCLPARKRLALAILLAIDPVTLGWGKTADAVIPVLCLLGYAVLMFRWRKMTAGLVLLALAMMGGERFWPVVAALLVCLLVVHFLQKRFADELSADQPGWKDFFNGGNLLIVARFWLIFSVALFAFPAGLNAAGAGILRGFIPVEGHDFRTVGALPLGMALLVYFGTALIFFFVRLSSAVRTQDTVLIVRMGGVLLFCVLLGVLRQGILILPWLSLPLYTFALDGLFEVLDRNPAERRDPFYLLAVVIPFGLCGFLYFRATELMRIGDVSLPLSFRFNGQLLTLALTRLQGYLILMVFAVLIFGIFIPLLLNYFSPGRVLPGLIRGFLAVVAVTLLTGTWAMAGLRTQADHPAGEKPAGRHELALGVQSSPLTSPLRGLLQEIGFKQDGSEVSAAGLVAVAEGSELREDAALRWQLHSFVNAGFSAVTDLQTDAPSYVITEAAAAEAPLSGYVGMPIRWKTSDDWASCSAADWLRWLLYREQRDDFSTLIFWQKTDLLAGEGQ